MHGRRPRPTSPAELLDDVIAELAASTLPAAPVVELPRPAPSVEPPPAANPQLVRRWSGAAALEVEEPPAAPPAPAAAPPPSPTPARRRRRLAVPAILRRPRVITGLGLAAIAVGLVSLVLVIVALLPAPAPADPAAATRLTVLPRGNASTLTMADAGALADRSVIPDATAVAPIVERSETVVAGGRRTTATMTGSTAAWLATTGHHLAHGRIFTPAEVTSGTHLAVLGGGAARRLFPATDPSGLAVTIAGQPFTVIGVLATPASGPDSASDVALVPVTAAQGITGTAGGRTVERILVSAPDQEAVYAAYQEVNNLLLQTHHTRNPFSTDFSVTAAALSAGRSAVGLWGLAILAVVAPLLGGVAILRLRRAS